MSITVKTHRYNNIKAWMNMKLLERGMSVERFELATGNRITKASIFRWYNGTFLPKEKSLELVCETLSKLPILTGSKPGYEIVTLAEAQAQFSTENARYQGGRRQR